MNNIFLKPEDNPKNASYHYKNMNMENVENSDLFNTYLKTKNFKTEFNGTLWSEGPCYIPHKQTLICNFLPK